MELDREENTFWPWVMGLVLLALVVWVVAEISGEPPEVAVEPAPVATPAAPAIPATGESLQAWVRDSAEAQERTSASGSYAAAGMRRVTGALRSLTGSNPAASEQMAAIADATARLDSIPEPAERVVAARTLFMTVVALVEGHTGAERGEALDRLLEEARTAAGSLDEATPLEEQRHRVFSFFDHISEAIRIAAAPAAGV